jgi:hypothetical protein
MRNTFACDSEGMSIAGDPKDSVHTRVCDENVSGGSDCQTPRIGQPSEFSGPALFLVRQSVQSGDHFNRAAESHSQNPITKRIRDIHRSVHIDGYCLRGTKTRSEWITVLRKRAIEPCAQDCGDDSGSVDSSDVSSCEEKVSLWIKG